MNKSNFKIDMTSLNPLKKLKTIFSHNKISDVDKVQKTHLVDLKTDTYKIEPMAQGSNCLLYLATTAQGNKTCLKLLKKQYNHQGVVRSQFIHETRMLQSLNHKHLPNFVEKGYINQQPYLMYEYTNGITLLDMINDRSIEDQSIIDFSLTIAKQMSEALSYLHNQIDPIVHGDISLENIIFDPDLNIKLLDLGCAHHLNNHDNEQLQWIGKPSYLTPEQAKREHWDHRSDFFQLGILLYELINRRRYNLGHTDDAKQAYAKAYQKPDELFIQDKVSSDYSKLVAKLLEPDIKYRFQTIEQIQQALENIKA